MQFNIPKINGKKKIYHLDETISWTKNRRLKKSFTLRILIPILSCLEAF